MVVLKEFPVPTEGVRHEQVNTTAHVQGQDLGTGTLFITESQVAWMSSAGQGFSLDYPAISLHAVSRDLSAFPHECLYLMVDQKLHDPGAAGDGNSSDNEDESERISEVRFIPEDKSSLENLFQNMADCQALHPDPDDSFSDEDFYGEEEDIENLSEEGQAQLQRLENIFISGYHSQEGDAEPQIGARAHQNGNGVTENKEEPMESGQFEDAD